VRTTSSKKKTGYEKRRQLRYPACLRHLQGPTAARHSRTWQLPRDSSNEAKFKDLRRLEAEDYFDLAEMLPEESGLPFVVFIMDRMESRPGVRLKVAPRLKWHRSEMLTVVLRRACESSTASLIHASLRLLSRWINLNRKTLLKYWENEIDTLGAYNS